MKNERSLILREQRLKLGLTPQDIGKAVGIDPKRYVRYEDGRMDIMNASFGVMCGIALLLGLDITRFYRGEYHVNEGLSIVDGKISYGHPEGGVKLFLRSKGYDVDAVGMFTFSNHLLVLEGSRISIDSNLREKGWETTQRLREELIDKGIIHDRVFLSEYDFHSPSEAACVICGRHISGTNLWVTEDGVTLGKLKRGK